MQKFIENNEKSCCTVKYKLVLTDLNMPQMDGFEAAERILKYQNDIKKVYPDYQRVPIVAVTAYEDQDTIDRCFKIGMVAVLHKPLNID